MMNTKSIMGFPISVDRVCTKFPKGWLKKLFVLLNEIQFQLNSLLQSFFVWKLPAAKL